MKIFVVNKRTLLTYCCVFLLLVVVATVNKDDAIAVFESTSKKDLPIYCVEKDEKICSISFDAAWGNEDTGELIKILDDFDVKATFFVVGDWVDRFPGSVKELHDAGHEVMNHSNTHAHYPSLSKEQMIEDVTRCDEKIEKITGVKPILFRPPYGDYNNDVVSAMREAGHYTIQWDVDSLDWKDLSARAIYDRVTSRVKNGSIVLFHNAAKNTPQALPMILKNLKDKGYKIVPISELIYKDNFKIDHTGMQIPTKIESNVE